MYFVTMVIPVPHDQHAAYCRWMAHSAALLRQHGCLQVLDGWDDAVPTGQRTDLRRAVAASEGEKIAVSWQVWPDKATLEAAEARLHASGALDAAGPPPFDAGRLILGCFAPLSSAAPE